MDFLSPALDTLFVLSRTSLDNKNPETFDTAYALLSRTLTLPGISSALQYHPPSYSERVEVDPAALANYLRCISGAFHNLSATLYQANKWGAAARFLQQACTLGEKAMAAHRQSNASFEGTDQKQQAWTQLEEQVFRRWELLGVCHLKTGDRQVELPLSLSQLKLTRTLGCL